MKIKQIYLFLIFLTVVFLSSLGFYYYKSIKEIPEKVLMHNETDINVDKIRFIFKTQNLCQRGISSFYQALNSSDKDKFEECCEYYEAAIGFINIKFTKVNNIKDYVEPRIEEILRLINENPLNISKIDRINDEIIYFLEGQEKLAWEQIHNSYTRFTTEKFSNIYLYKSLTALVIYIIFLLSIILYLQIRLSNERKKEQKILMEQSKNASMGEMIGNIAHQWRQPLSVISTGATGLKFSKEYGTLTDEQFDQICDSINDNAQYLSKTIDDFRNFIKGERKKVLFNLYKNIGSFLSLVEGSVKNNQILIVEDVDTDISINGYPNELIQCFINIFNNSKDALKNVDTQKYFFISGYKEDDNVVIIFKDNAGGVPDTVLPHIFEPYFTTKHQSKGTGLGLHMTYNLIINGMKGTIQASNTEYKYKDKDFKGAKFKITLPLS